MATLATSAPSASAAGNMIGACTAHWPPPDGTKIFTTPALIKLQNGSDSALAMATKPEEILCASPDCTITAMMPA